MSLTDRTPLRQPSVCIALALTLIVPLPTCDRTPSMDAVVGPTDAGRANAAAGAAAMVTWLASVAAGQSSAIVTLTGGKVIVCLPGVRGGLPVTLVGGDETRPVWPDFGGGLGAFGAGLALAGGGGTAREPAGGPAGVAAGGGIGVELRAMAALPRGELLLLVADARGRAAVGGLWRWRPGAAAVRVADERAVADVSGLGSQLALADAQAVADDGAASTGGIGGGAWVILRSPDQTAVLRVDTGPAGGALRLSKAFGRIDGDDPAWRLSADDRWFAGAAADAAAAPSNGAAGNAPGAGDGAGGLRLLRPKTGETWRLDASGRLTPLPPVDGRPPESVPPLSLPGEGGSGPRVVRFYPAPPPAAPDAAAAEEAVRYPAIVVTSHGTDTVIDRDGLKMRAGFPVHALRLTAWCPDPAGGGVIAYDAMSGEVMRIGLGG